MNDTISPNEVPESVKEAFGIFQRHLDHIDQGRKMDEGEWDSTFYPIENPREGSTRFDPDDEAQYLANLDEHHIWTEVEYDEIENPEEGECSTIFALLPGRHRGNRCGFMVTLVPWTDD